MEHPDSIAVPIKEPLDPYLQNQTGRNQILDGLSAMNARISLKYGLLREKERDKVLVLLKRYCDPDTYTIVNLCHH